MIEKLGVLKKGRLKSFEDGIETNGFRVIMFIRQWPLWLGFFIAFILAIMMMMVIPMIWYLIKEKKKSSICK